jgi:3-methylfumaryl-CoA hydratase
MSGADQWRDYVGRSRVRTGQVDPVRVAALCDLLEVPDEIESAPSAPPGMQWLAFETFAPRRETGPDGHPRRGDFLPPIDLPRRMFAGARLRATRALPVGKPLTCTERIDAVKVPESRGGALVLVTLQRDYGVADGACLTELATIAYTDDAPRRGAGGAPATPDEDGFEILATRTFDAIDLFRYSALTFNSHRIHYDADYAREREGYPGLVVHGPLLASALMALAGSPSAFEFRSLRPSYANEPLTFLGSPASGLLQILGPGGDVRMEASC